MPPSRSPKVLKGALARLDEDGAPAEIVVFQYNPTKLFRRIERRAGKPEAPPREFVSCTLLLDATDALERPDQNPLAAEQGIYATLAALELFMHPPGPRGRRRVPLPHFSIHPRRTPVIVFIWGAKRTVPVRLERLDILEILHDPSLRPIRATVKVIMRVITDLDIPRGHPAAKVWRQHLETMRLLAGDAYEDAPPA